MSSTLYVSVLAAALAVAGCSEAPAASSPSPSPSASTAEEGPIEIDAAVQPGTVQVKISFSRPIPSKKGKRYRLALSKPEAELYSGPHHFVDPGTTEDQLASTIEDGPMEVRLLESDGPECSGGPKEGGPCAENERVIAKSKPFIVEKRPE